MSVFCHGRSLAVTKEVLPARKSLRLQNKEAAVLTLPPEPKDTPNSQEVADMTHHASLLLPGSFCCCCLSHFCVFFQALSSQEAPRPSAHGSNQHGGGKQAASTTPQALLWGGIGLKCSHVLFTLWVVGMPDTYWTNHLYVNSKQPISRMLNISHNAPHYRGEPNMLPVLFLSLLINNKTQMILFFRA